MHFEENQLSRNLIGLSPLTTSHRNSFQPICVRSSTKFYPRFNLPMVSSSRFGSTACNLRPIQTRFPFDYIFNDLILLHTITRRLIMQKVRYQALQ
eukprot:UN26686